MSYHADKLMIDARTDRRTDTQTDADNDNTRRPKLASGKKLHCYFYKCVILKHTSLELCITNSHSESFFCFLWSWKCKIYKDDINVFFSEEGKFQLSWWTLFGDTLFGDFFILQLFHIGQLAITWTNDDQDPPCHMVSWGHN